MTSSLMSAKKEELGYLKLRKKKKKILDKERITRTPARSHRVSLSSLKRRREASGETASASAHHPWLWPPQASPSPLWGRRWAGQPGPQPPAQPTPAFLEQGACRAARWPKGWGTGAG